MECGPVRPATSSTTYVPTSGPVTTYPPDTPTTPTTFKPDADHGVLQGHLVQQVMCVTAPCPPQPSSGKVQINSPGTNGGPPTTSIRDVGPDGDFSALLAPGPFTINATTDSGKDCPKQTVTITAGQVTELTIECPIG
jgi:hypothetical protein